MTIDIKIGDCREVLKQFDAESFDCCITSPPYWGLRDYGTATQLGLEETPEQYTKNMVEVFSEVRRVLKDEGTLWLNLGDSYSSGGRTTTTNQTLRGDKDYGVTRPASPEGIKPKDLIGIPWRVALALQADGWYLRQDIIWSKPNPMPESVKDRCTKSHEYIFLLSKQPKYYFDHEAIKEDAATEPVKRDKMAEGYQADYPKGKRFSEGERVWGSDKKNKRSVWTVSSKPFSGAHFATFPPDLIEPCVLAGCPEGGHILDPFGGAGTTALVADRFKRNATLIELNNEYADIAKNRLQGDAPLFSEIEVA